MAIHRRMCLTRPRLSQKYVTLEKNVINPASADLANGGITYDATSMCVIPRYLAYPGIRVAEVVTLKVVALSQTRFGLFGATLSTFPLVPSTPELLALSRVLAQLEALGAVPLALVLVADTLARRALPKSKYVRLKIVNHFLDRKLLNIQ